MKHNIIRTALIALIGGAGLILGAGTAAAESAEAAPRTAPAGQYVLIHTDIGSPLPTGVDLATVTGDGSVIVGGRALPGVKAQRIDFDGNGHVDHADPILAMDTDSEGSIGELRR